MRALTAIGLAITVAACGGPELTRQALDVRSVTDASGCELIESTYLESRPQLMHDYVRRNVAAVGGDSYKINHVGQDAALGAQIAMVTYEAYRCRPD